MKLSVIIPAYNTEEYIGQAIESVLKLDIEKEIILINDGSTDETLKIMEQYKKENENEIILINKKNEGVAVARNSGLKKATGDYIYFLDSDDWIETKSFEKIIKKLLKNVENDIDVVIGKEKVYSEYTKEEYLDERIPKNLINEIITGKDYLKKALEEKFWNVRLPIHLYNRKLLEQNEIYFPINRKTNEDEIFTINILCKAKKIKIEDEILGYYRARSGSIMSKLNINHAMDIFENAKELTEKYKNEEDIEKRKMVFYMIKKYYKSSMKKAIQCDRKDIFNKIYEEFQKSYKKYFLKIKFRKFENIDLCIIYYTKSLIFVVMKKIKELKRKEK